MALKRWNPRCDYTKQDDRLLRRLRKTRKLFAFLRDHRRELFDDAFQAELEATYRNTGAGKDPTPPALLAMVVLLQSYRGTSDAEAMDLTVMDLRWQMVLDLLGSDEPAFGQGTLVEFRERLIRSKHGPPIAGADRRGCAPHECVRLEKAAEDAAGCGGLEPSGRRRRVEDTINLLAHAARKVVDCAAALLGWTADRVAREAGIPLLLESGVTEPSTSSGASRRPRPTPSTPW